MKNQACEPCAKRKVRCNREEPCSNCKRRKKDHCTYPEMSPAERIRQLEAHVRNLGGDPGNNTQGHDPLSGLGSRKTGKSQSSVPDENRLTTRHLGPRSADPVLTEEGGHMYYLESFAWQNWLGHDYRDGALRERPPRNPFLTRAQPNALQRLLGSHSPIVVDGRLPVQAAAAELWAAFYQRVNPIIRICFSWELKRLQSASESVEQQRKLSDTELTFLSSLYLISVISLTEDECLTKLGQPRSLLISDIESFFEEALSRVGLLYVNDIMVLKALTIYIAAGADRLSTQSLWSVLGIVTRSAERLGIHRDGTLLGLSPAETEERRRLWWHLQHLDLGLAVRSGLTSLSMSADWDAKMPLNIEDDDIDPTMTDFPNERRGLTSMAYCLFAYWVIDQQRQFFRVDQGRFELSWQSNTQIPQHVKESMMDRLEEGINQNFLQYCDPAQPLDALVQILARFLICGMHMRVLHPLVCSGSPEGANQEPRRQLLSLAVKCLQYDIILFSQASLKQFYWWSKSWFSWHAFTVVVVEVAHQTEADKSQRIWNLLANLYSVYPLLTELTADRRNGHAAELVVSAWKACQAKFNPEQLPVKPDFLVGVEAQLEASRMGLGQGHWKEDSTQRGSTPNGVSTGLHQTIADSVTAFSSELDFADIDWSFWTGFD